MTRRIAALLLFGISFGYLEAAVVVYLRSIYDPIRQQLHPERRPGDLFPLISPEQLAATGPDHTRQLGVELGRELATILMLAGFAMVAGRNFYERFAAFAIAFGLWDIFFYVFLKLLIQWPESLFTWDILFLVPLPWVGPVLAPVLVSLTMIVCGGVSLYYGGLRAGPLEAGAIVLGGLVIIASFIWDYRNIMSSGLPNPFNWPLWMTGEAIGMAGFLAAIKHRGYPVSQTLRDS